MTTYGSVCSGIEAATIAFAPLGWRASWFSEIERFPCAVLAHHFPTVPNLGDMTTIARRVLTGDVAAPDVLCGGTPCQAFSVAGLRESLSDARGNLTLKFVGLADAIDHVRGRAGLPACIVLWENVPGVLSTKDNAFGCFLAGLAGEDEPLQPPGNRWEDAGAVLGPQRAIAWRTLDAQYFGLAQRRRRVFLVASARNGFDPCSVLFEWQGVRRDTPPSRQSRQDLAGTLSARSEGGGGLGTDFDLSGGVQVTSTLDASYHRLQGASGQDANHGHSHLVTAYGGNRTSGSRDVASALRAKGGSGHGDFESETFIAHSLRGEGFDASEDGTGRGTPLVSVSLALRGRDGGATAELGDDLAFTLRASDGGGDKPHVLAFDTTQVTSVLNRSNPKPGDPCHALSAGMDAPAIAFDCKASGQSGFSVGEVAGTQRAMGHANSHTNGGGHQAALVGSTVRRLTPRECERLQGFKDDYTLIPYGRAIKPEKLDADFVKYLMRGGVMSREECARAAADGPRYKALGNSWAVPCVRWIAHRIDQTLEEPQR